MAHWNYHVIAAGEILVDLISTEYAATLADAGRFHRFAGGAPSNVARNVALLGGKAAFVGCVGSNGFGHFLQRELHRAGVDTRYIRAVAAPTTLAIVARHTQTPDFILYRGADRLLSAEQLPSDLLARARVLHVSAFALSREPSRSAILHALALARQHGVLVSLDPNTHPRLWEPHTDPLSVLRQAYAFVDITKPSFDDCHRLFGPDLSPETCLDRFLALGPSLVVLTMGEQGLRIRQRDGASWAIPAPRVTTVADVTGAGDAFWAAFLLALLDGYPPPQAAEVGQAFAAMHIAQLGPLQNPIDRQALYRQISGSPPPRQG